MSETNRVILRYIDEVTYGITPTDGVWQKVRFNSDDLTAQPQTTQSEEIRDDRMISDLILTSMTVGGGYQSELSYGSFDDFMEMAMGGTWATDVLKAGTVKRSVSIEKEYADIAKFILFKGMRVGTMAINAQFGQIATIGFGFAGNGSTSGGTSTVGLGSTTAVNTNDVMSGADVANILVDGSAATVDMRNIGINLDNNLRPIEALGSVAPSNQAYGSSNITGTIEAYFEDLAFYDALINSTAKSIQWEISDGTNTYTLLIPKLKFNDGAPPTPGKDQDVLQSLGFTALFDSATGTNLQITRSV